MFGEDFAGLAALPGLLEGSQTPRKRCLKALLLLFILSFVLMEDKSVL